MSIGAGLRALWLVRGLPPGAGHTVQLLPAVFARFGGGKEFFEIDALALWRSHRFGRFRELSL